MLIETLCLLVVLFGLFYYYMTSKYDYWKTLGIKQLTPSFPFGNYTPLFTNKKNSYQLMEDWYSETKDEKYFGVYFLRAPVLAINDLDLLKKILVSDFDHFVNRDHPNVQGFFGGVTETDKLMANQLTALSGEKWKSVRDTFTPIFTSAKMKLMTDIMIQVTKSLNDYLIENPEFNIKETCTKTTMESMAKAVFATEANAFTDEETPFVKYGKSLFKSGLYDLFKFVTTFIPGNQYIRKFFNISIAKVEPTLFFYNVVKDILKIRTENPQKFENSNDLIRLMIEAMNNDKKDIDEIKLVATAMVLLMAGYETTSSSLCYVFYELALHPEYQKKLQDEIDEAFEDEGNSEFISYTKIQSMTYLDMIINETLRFHPGSVGIRNVTKPWKIPDSNITLDRSQSITYLVSEIHRDPRYYPYPKEFNPQNFLKEHTEKRHPYAYLPFGHGPRSCIAKRFALLQMRIATIAVLHRFNLEKTDKTLINFKIDPASPTGGPLDPLIIKAVSRN